MTEAVRGLLGKCVAALVDEEAGKDGHEAGGLLGTAFFIAENFLLTAAHVVAGHHSPFISVHWQDRTDLVARVRNLAPSENLTGSDIYPLPDLAVLEIVNGTDLDHPCVLLSEVSPTGMQVAEGYARATVDKNAFSNTAAIGKFETNRLESGGTLIECSGGWPPPGMSGSPLLDIESGTVVGCVKAQRSERFRPGLCATSTNALQGCWPDLWAANRMFHERDTRWLQETKPESTIRNRRRATEVLIDRTIATVTERTRNLPEGVSRADLHQTVWVSRVPSGSPGTTDLASPEVPTDRMPANRFRWQPSQATNNTTVVRGLPGHGKSWLLAYHVEALAAESKHQLESGGDLKRVRLPLFMDCASFASMLPQRPEEDDICNVLVGSLRLTGAFHDAETDCRLLVKEAFATGRLTVCLDGFDEVPQDHLARLGTALSHLIVSRTRTLIATRHTALKQLDDLPFDGRVDIETLGFTSREASRFVASWLKANPSARETLDRALVANAPLRTLAEVPLLLSFLCRLADDPEREQGFPSSRAEIYDEVLKWLLSGRWHKGARNPHSPPDPERRLRALASAMGAIQDRWRASGQLLSRTEIEVQLRRNEDYDYLYAAASARWDAWQRSQNAVPGAPPAEPVLWEFMFDGLVAEEPDNGPEGRIRLLHPALREIILANYLAQMNEEQWRAALERHRWFDSDWQGIFALATRLMPEPDSLINAILEESDDPWFTQVGFAADCVAEAGASVSAATASKVVDLLLDTERISRDTDKKRCILDFARLVNAGIDVALDRSRQIRQEGTSSGTVRYLETVCALAESPVYRELSEIHQVILEDSTPQEYRRRLVRAITARGRAEDIAFVRTLLVSTHERFGPLLGAFLAGVRPYSGAHLEAASHLLRVRTFNVPAGVTIGETMLECGEDAREAVVEAARDKRLSWNLRIRLFGILVDAGETELVPEAIELLQNPNVVALHAARTVVSLLRVGDTASLTRAAAMVAGRTWISKDERLAVAHALCDLGTVGADMLKKQVTGNMIDLPIMIDHLRVLIEHRDEEGTKIAVGLCADEGMGYRRIPLFLSLLSVNPRLCDPETMLTLVGDDHVPMRLRLTLAVQMARFGFRDAAPVVMGLVEDLRDDDVDLGEYIRSLASGQSHVGREVLEAIAKHESLPWTQRIQSLIALVNVRSRHAADAIDEAVAAGIPNPWQNHLYFGLTSEGSSRFLQEVTDSLTEIDGAYEVLRRFMHGPSATMADYETIAPRLRSAMSYVAPERSKVSIDEEFLESCGLTWTSNTQFNALRTWFTKLLPRRVGDQLAKFMKPHQLDEFEVYMDDKDDAGALEYIEAWFPHYRGFTAWTREKLRDDIRAGRLVPPDLTSAEATPVMTIDRITSVGLHVRELVALGGAGKWTRYFEFLDENSVFLLSPEADGIIRLAMANDQSYVYEAHYFVIRHAASEGVDAVREMTQTTERMRDCEVSLLDEGNFSELFLAGMHGVVRYDEGPHYFYAALGAQGDGKANQAQSIMRSCGSKVGHRKMIDDGMRTIRETAESWSWPQEESQPLIEQLELGFSERSPDES